MGIHFEFCPWPKEIHSFSTPRSKSLLQKFYGRHHNLVYRCEISISQVTMDLLLFTQMFSFLYHCQSIYRTWLYIWITRRVSYKKQELLTLCEHLNSPPVFWWGPCCSSFQFFVLSYCICVFTFWVLCCDVQYDFRIKAMFGSFLPPVVCLIYVILLCVFTFLVLYCDVRFAFTSSCLSYLRYPIMCLYVPCSVLWCSVRLYLQSFVLFMFSYYVSLRSEFCVVMSVTISA
jgi:hypothetical protein